jgi:excisionase family DNA binding protein
MQDEEYYSVQQIAARLHVGTPAVRRWINSGRLRATMPGGQRIGFRVRASDLEAFLKATEIHHEANENRP